MAVELRFDYLKGKAASPIPTPTTPFERAEERQVGREDLLDKARLNITTQIKSPIDVPIRMGALAFQLPGGAFQRGEAAISNAAMEAQEMQQRIDEAQQQQYTGIPYLDKRIGKAVGFGETAVESSKGVLEGLTGERIGEFGDVYTRAGATEKQSRGLGLLTGAALTHVATGGAFLKKLPKLHTDKLMVETSGKLASDITSKMSDLRSSYKMVYEPFNRNIVPFAKVREALNAIKGSRVSRDLFKRFTSRTLDKSGNPIVTVENLNNMRFWIDDLIKSPKEQLTKMGSSSQELLKLKSALSNLSVKQLSREGAKQIGVLNKQFKPLLDKGNAVLRDLVGPGGKIRTERLAKMFKNPDYSGSREFLRDLKSIGIDTADILKLFTQYAKREGVKKFAGRAGETALRWGLISGALRKGLNTKDDTVRQGNQ